MRHDWTSGKATKTCGHNEAVAIQMEHCRVRLDSMEHSDQLSNRLAVANPVENNNVRSEMANVPSCIEDAVHESDSGVGDSDKKLPDTLLIVEIGFYRMIVDQDIHALPLGRQRFPFIHKSRPMAVWMIRTDLRKMTGHA